MDDDDYEVGYGKPPKSTRFQKGQSGNPRGKKPGTKSLATIFHEVTTQLIQITENGEARTVTKLEAIMLQLVTKALSGDMKALREIRSWNQTFEQAESTEGPNKPDLDKDKEVVRKFLERVNETTTDKEEPSHDLAEESND